MRTTQAWLRFEHERQPYGVFSYIAEAKPTLPEEQRLEIDSLMVWINEYLDAPEDVSLDRERFWFREEAHEMIAKVRRVAALVRAAGVPIVERRTARIPGKVRWEDKDQVAVITYRDTPQPRR